MAERELIDQVDESNVIVGQVSRRAIHEEGLWHRVVHVWGYSSSPAPKVLFQRRSMTQHVGAGLLDSTVAGHVEAGVSPDDTAQEETKDEIGLVLDRAALGSALIHKGAIQTADEPVLHRRFAYIYFVELDENTDFAFNDGEVEEMIWLDYDRLKGFRTDEQFLEEFICKDLDYTQMIVDRIGELVG